MECAFWNEVNWAGCYKGCNCHSALTIDHTDFTWNDYKFKGEWQLDGRDFVWVDHRSNSTLTTDIVSDQWGVHTFKRSTGNLLESIVDRNHARATALVVYNYLSSAAAVNVTENHLNTGSHITINGYTFVVSRVNEDSDVYEVTLTQKGKILRYFVLTSLNSGISDFNASIVNANKWEVLSNQHIILGSTGAGAFSSNSTTFEITAEQQEAYLTVVRENVDLTTIVAVNTESKVASAVYSLLSHFKANINPAQVLVEITLVEGPIYTV